MKSSKHLPILLLIITILAFFYPFWLRGKLPIPADTIVGLYHPYRDLYAKDYPRGIPFKNSLITDPVRQQYPWRYLTTLLEKNFSLPLWNPYSFTGTPLLANMQSAAFYPLNILFLLTDFNNAWGLLILLQPLLSGLFMYLYLRNLKLNDYSCFLGGLTFAFCGFSIAWLEWGTIGHTALWLPLILLSLDKFFITYSTVDKSNIKNQISKIQLKVKNLAGASLQLAPKHSEVGFIDAPAKFLGWGLIFVFSLTSSFFAGHLQTFFYLYIISLVYFIARWLQYGRKKRILFSYLILNTLFVIFTAVQWLPTLRLILLSARDIDQSFQKEGWFLPVQHLIQFVAPDFFGNPATLNYWGVWNYGEFIGYVSILPLVMSLFALFYRYDKKTIFFGSIFFLSLIFALPTWFAKIPFTLQIPFINTAQPTRLLFLTDFSLSVLAALGFDLFISSKRKVKILYPLAFIFLIYVSLWVFVFTAPQISKLTAENISVAKNNLYLPTLIFGVTLTILIFSVFIKTKKLQIALICALIAITIIDLFRFSYKFTPFTDKKYLYPATPTTYLVLKYSGLYRMMTTDARIMPPNFSIMHDIQSIDGYDPLYIRRYGELIAAMERNVPNIKPPFGFDRIINPHNYNSKIADLLGVKYILSLNDLTSAKLKKIFMEGETRIYENNDAFDRTFFVNQVYAASNKDSSIKALFDENIDLKNTAVVENWDHKENVFENKNSKAEIINYESSQIIIRTETYEEGFIVLTDTFYPTWKARICSLNKTDCKETKIYLTDYNFRGILVPGGEHTVIFYITLL